MANSLTATANDSLESQKEEDRLQGVELNSKMQQIILEIQPPLEHQKDHGQLVIGPTSPCPTAKEITDNFPENVKKIDDLNNMEAEEESISVPPAEPSASTDISAASTSETGSVYLLLTPLKDVHMEIDSEDITDPLVSDSSKTPETPSKTDILVTPSISEGMDSTTDDANFKTPIPSSKQFPSTSTNCSTSTTISSSVKKSNLRKISKYEGSSVTDGTPRDPNPTPRKRIRILENLDVQSPQNRIELSNPNALEDDDLLDDARMSRTNHFEEEMVWISPSSRPIDFRMVNAGYVGANRKPVAKKFSVEIEYRFIDNDTLTDILRCKLQSNILGAFAYEKFAWQNCPFQDVQSALPQSPISNTFKFESNAMKLANLDAALDFDLTYPKNFFNIENPLNPTPSNSKEPSVFYFGDIWVNSKGFREYILWKNQSYLNTKGTVCKGFAMGVVNGARAQKDFNEKTGVLFSSVPTDKVIQDEDLPGLPVELVEHFTGDGMERKEELDLTDIEVSDGFIKRILDSTDGKGVHLLVADNPESFNLHETVREVRFQRNLYCQCIIALLAVREGGNFVVKIFDSITPFTVGLIFLLHRCFKIISIHKPRGSPTHISERFLICKEKLDNYETEDIAQFLLQCHTMVVRNEETRRIVRKRLRRKLSIEKMEVKELVPFKVISSQAEFFEYIRLVNMRFSKLVSSGIDALLPYVNCPENHPPLIRSARAFGHTLKNELKIIPTLMSKTKMFSDPQELIIHLWRTEKERGSKTEDFWDKGFWQFPEKGLNSSSLKEISENSESWKVFIVQDSGSGGRFMTHGRGVFIGLGRGNVYYFTESHWKQVYLRGLELTRGTVFYGELVDEIICTVEDESEKSQEIQQCCHIFDSVFLHGEYIGDLSFDRRRELTRSYVSALRKIGNESEARVLRVWDPIEIYDLGSLSSTISKKELVGYKNIMRTYQFCSEGKNNWRILAEGLLFWKSYPAENNSFLKSLKEGLLWQWNEHKEEQNMEIRNGSLLSLKEICDLKMKA